MIMKNLPQKYLSDKNRKEMWKDAKKILKKLDNDLSEIYVIGSAISKKKNANDIDLAIITKAKSNKNLAYPVDLIILPNNEDHNEYLKFFKKYMKKKYGKNVKPVRLK